MAVDEPTDRDDAGTRRIYLAVLVGVVGFGAFYWLVSDGTSPELALAALVPTVAIQWFLIRDRDAKRLWNRVAP